MKPEPKSDIETHTIKVPPATGPGSGKEAWRALDLWAIEANAGLSATIKEQAEALRDVRAEVEPLRRQIAIRRPPGGREPLADDKVDRIEATIRTGESTRSIASGFKVGSRHRTGTELRKADGVV